MTLADRLASLMTSIAGSMPYVWLHVAWFAIWIAVNVNRDWAFDPYPFTFLTMIVSLEAIFLATFVLIAENRQASLADKRAKLDLQVNMIAESEVTKLIQLVEEIREQLGLPKSSDPEFKLMNQRTRLRRLADEMESQERKAQG
ncbi:MAG TPA: DUF1003 domain-containing protein [Dehalococcoidia bacterium]|jgi:uncharacterized membrane protein|nr:DUF1003 domain-containing protein [Dehalococcoidia bacterium]